MERVLFSRVLAGPSSGFAAHPDERDAVTATPSYPPPRHLLADLRLAILRRGDALAVTAPAVPEIRNRAGYVGAGALGVAVDVFGGNLALRAIQPDWCVTSTLDLHLLRPLARDFEVTGAPLRSGRTSVVVDVTVDDGSREGRAAVACMTFTRIPRRRETIPFREPSDERTVFGNESAGLREPFLDRIGCRVLDASAGVVELAVEDYVRNSVGALQGGAVVALIDAAAEAVASARMAEDATTRDLQVHFLALGRVGPIRSRARWLAGEDGERATLRVELFDTGAEDRLLSVATVVLARPRSGT
jgi:acyl-coenzyme A thioesterase PaaI-like protein